MIDIIRVKNMEVLAIGRNDLNIRLFTDNGKWTGVVHMDREQAHDLIKKINAALLSETDIVATTIHDQGGMDDKRSESH
jgi:hypothetical protein